MICRYSHVLYTSTHKWSFNRWSCGDRGLEDQKSDCPRREFPGSRMAGTVHWKCPWTMVQWWSIHHRFKMMFLAFQWFVGLWSKIPSSWDEHARPKQNSRILICCVLAHSGDNIIYYIIIYNPFSCSWEDIQLRGNGVGHVPSLNCCKNNFISHSHK